LIQFGVWSFPGRLVFERRPIDASVVAELCSVNLNPVTGKLQNVQLNIIQPAHFEGEGKFLASITMQRIAAAVVAEQITTEVWGTRI